MANYELLSNMKIDMNEEIGITIIHKFYSSIKYKPGNIPSSEIYLVCIILAL